MTKTMRTVHHAKWSQDKAGTFRFGLRVLFVVLVSAITLASLLPVEYAPKVPGLSDKVEHTAAYMVMTFIGALAFRCPRAWLYLAPPLICFGVVLEIGQYFVPGRYPDVLDGIANAVGVVLGVTVFQILRKWRLPTMH